MRAVLFLTTTCASLAIIAACASSEEQTPQADAPPPSPPPATTPDADAAVDSSAPVPDASLPKCSDAGWCITAFPDADLVFRDVWPLEDRAFAIAESASEGVKVLEWLPSSDTWQYIDDQTQNETGIGTFAGRIYAPNANEVYFTVGPAYVYWGKRPSAEAPWSWTRSELPDHVVGHPLSHEHGNPNYAVAAEKRVTLGVWGSGTEDVYAWYSNAIFRRDASDRTWSTVYVAENLEAPTEHIFFTAVDGTGPDDVWFVGARDRGLFHCPLAVRKSAAGWERFADGIVQNNPVAPCRNRPGTMLLGDTGGGWLTDIHRSSATEYLALHDAVQRGGFKNGELMRVHVEDAGYSFTSSVVPVRTAKALLANSTIRSMWRWENENWFSSWGLVLRGTDDGDYEISSISRDGAPVDVSIVRIRGTSKQNIWAIGARHAYHKTTP
ncbi:hypothetical protein AKJ09_02303 [Labilithrix luteola]|uniref:Uncharacterized protein n=1 Tax=Labilithrix luteola TaxID=1391654 RepID=A0A0K1PRA0_9BACT|nr:hypothetical protein [Labilithrix luteola]AKU95639.1 hypothetical protein AKJ09_02303 [Labilithrix luteola]